jgi:arylsulfate sulfotransferase
MTGRLVREWSVLPEFHNIHHDVFEKPNGNFLVTADKIGIDTIEDFIIELDRSSGAIVNTWDLRQILPKRPTLVRDDRDWFHINAVIHDPRDDSIIVSGQRQGVVKITADNRLRWILAPPDGWEGYEQFLLASIPSADFEWIWGQHAPLLLPNGDLMLFDNGFGREYGAAAKYSRIVRYRVTENALAGGTVQQVWHYGKNRGEELYSPIVSDVDHLPSSDTYLMSAGSLLFNLDYVSPTSVTFSADALPDMARILEVNEAGDVLFELVVQSESPAVLLYRAEKIGLYPPG